MYVVLFIRSLLFFIDCIPVSYIINVFIFLFIHFYTGPVLIAVFITEMVILFKRVIIIIIIIIIITAFVVCGLTDEHPRDG